MPPINWHQYADICGAREFLKGPPTTLPIAPFPGLAVGALVVRAVFINQGAEGICEVHYQAVSESHAKILEGQGWRRESLDD